MRYEQVSTTVSVYHKVVTHDYFESLRIGEHHVRRQQLAALVQAVTSKSIDLLTPPQASAVLGVQEERLLKAEKWKLANRLRDTRNAIEKGRMDLDTGKLKTRINGSCCAGTY